MTQAQDQVIADILKQVQQEVGPTRFNVWFNNSTQLTLQDRELQVGVPNLFVCDYMESHFSTVITRVARQASGAELAVRFHIDPKLFRKRRQLEIDQGQEFLEHQASRHGKSAQPDGAAANTGRGPSSMLDNVATALAGSLPRNGPLAVAPRPGKRDASGGPLLTFESFIVGSCNRMAYAAAREVAEKPGKVFNPLFIHGTCGLGKTHLLQGIVHAITQRDPRAQVLYITAEEFTNRYIMAIKTRSLDAFRHRFRGLDVLVIDDIHFLAGKQATQEEFLHTFNAFDMANRQVVMASDNHPKMLTNLQDNLVNRFVSGMVAKLTMPDRRTRTEILRQKAAKPGHRVPDEVLSFIAQRVTGNVRELEGALVRVIAYASLDRKPISLSLAREALGDYLESADKTLGLDAIIETVSRCFSVSRADLLSSKRTRHITVPRQVAMFLARRLTPMSYPDIGRQMGDKNHTTVMAACRRVEDMVKAAEVITWHDGTLQRQAAAGELIESLEDELHR